MTTISNATKEAVIDKLPASLLNYTDPAAIFIPWQASPALAGFKRTDITLNGRPSVQYSSSISGITTIYVADKEYGICMRSEITASGITMKNDVKNFKAEEVKATDFNVPAGYTITDLTKPTPEPTVTPTPDPTIISTPKPTPTRAPIPTDTPRPVTPTLKRTGTPKPVTTSTPKSVLTSAPKPTSTPMPKIN